MNPVEIEGDDLFIYSLTIPGFSLGKSRWGKYLILFYYSSANISIVELAITDIKEID
jgi:hypothetical protein